MKRVCGVTLTALLCCSLAATPGTTRADEPKQPEKKTESKKTNDTKAGDKKTDETAPVYTNADLARMFGDTEDEAEKDETAEAADRPDSKEAAKDKDKPADDPLKWLEGRRARQAEKDKRVAEAEQAVEAAQRKVANLETQLLAVRNPYAKRPELSDEEKEARRNSTETAEERYERTEKMLAEARAELDAAEEKLSQVRSEPVDRSD